LNSFTDNECLELNPLSTFKNILLRIKKNNKLIQKNCVFILFREEGKGQLPVSSYTKEQVNKNKKHL